MSTYERLEDAYLWFAGEEEAGDEYYTNKFIKEPDAKTQSR